MCKRRVYSYLLYLARGRKRLHLLNLNTFAIERIGTYLPREGPETDKSHLTPPTTSRV